LKLNVDPFVQPDKRDKQSQYLITAQPFKYFIRYFLFFRADRMTSSQKFLSISYQLGLKLADLFLDRIFFDFKTLMKE